jgi:integrase/recombinase XerC
MTTERFLDYLAYEKRYSQHTIKAYCSDLEQFSSYLQEYYSTDDPGAAGHQMIRSWIVSMMEAGQTARTANRKITTLKSFYRFLLKEGSISENPMSRVTAPKTSARLPVFVEQESMNNLFEDVDFGEGFPAIRDRVIMEMLYATGMRLSELINLEIAGIDLYGKSLKVTGKRNKQRIIPLADHMVSLLRQYLAIRSETFTEDKVSTHLFLTNKGEQLYPKMVYRTVHHYLDQVTTISKRSPHVIRHTFATHMLNNGADLNAIKEILGHANLAATQVYTHNTIDKLKSIYKQAHPRA